MISPTLKFRIPSHAVHVANKWAFNRYPDSNISAKILNGNRGSFHFTFDFKIYT